MDWHTLADTTAQDPIVFEKRSLDRIGLIPEIISRTHAYFRHIFAGGYSAAITAISGPRFWTPMRSRRSRKTVCSTAPPPGRFEPISLPPAARTIPCNCTKIPRQRAGNQAIAGTTGVDGSLSDKTAQIKRGGYGFWRPPRFCFASFLGAENAGRAIGKAEPAGRRQILLLQTEQRSDCRKPA